MRDALAHRGPDGAGLWRSRDERVALAQRRLAIIDLSPTGAQPISNEAETVWLVFNGEIYNYRELRAQLEDRGHRFRSRSDSETIVHAYEEWGTQCVSRLRGMFAFAIWDDVRREFFLARDHTGIKPLFYYWDSRTFGFASEIKALWSLGALDRSVDRSAVFDYLTYLYVPAPKTAYARVRKLRPGHWLRFDGEHVRESQYWDLPLVPDDAITEASAVRRVQDALADAVGMSMVSDVPVGAFLSGGLDSSIVVAHMATLASEPVRTFTIGFDVAKHDERQYARQVASKFQTLHRERVVGAESVRELIARLVGVYDEPYADGSAMPTFRVSELAREDVKVVLSGDGGDEVFAGYRWYSRWFRQRRLARHFPAPWSRRAVAAFGHAWPPSAPGARVKHLLEGVADEPFIQYARQMELLSPAEKRLIVAPEWADEFADYDDYWYLRQYWHPELDSITRLQYIDIKTYLPDDILTKVDRAAMAVGLEVRPPLLDHQLLETVFQVPGAIRFRNSEKKYLLKRVAAERLPDTILNRGKKGFSAPLLDWMEEDLTWVRERLADRPKIFRQDALDRLGRLAWGAKCWTLLVLQQWSENEPAL